VPREITHRYVDPMSEVWLGAARTIGLRIERSAGAYATTDGAGTLVIGSSETLDADDSLAQMIFHELCHSLVQGEDSFAAADWGLDNIGDDDVWREHATLRLQRVLAARHGLAGFFAPTTDFRSFWDALPADPLADRGDQSVIHAIAGLRRAPTPPWAPALEDALAATASIVATASRFAGAAPGAPASLAAGFAVPALHPTGLPAGAAPDRTCGGCAWRLPPAGGKRPRCRQAGATIDDAWPGCERWEPALDCQTCGACCREAYGAVAVGARDLVRTRRPTYVVDRGAAGAHRYELRRDGDRCAALAGGEITADGDRRTRARFSCVIYDDRPRTCRDFTLGSAHCLTARRRVGLSL
jgi:Fe-S-cluster containining protein